MKYFISEHPESRQRCETAAEFNKYKICIKVTVFQRLQITAVVINYKENNKCIGDCEEQIPSEEIEPTYQTASRNLEYEIN
jgi:hypothetical protein